MHIFVLATITTAFVKDSRSETLKKPIYYVILFDSNLCLNFNSSSHPCFVITLAVYKGCRESCTNV